MLTAQTLVSNMVLHRFTSPLCTSLCSSAVTISLHSAVHIRYPPYATLPNTDTTVFLLLNAGLTSGIFDSVPVSQSLALCLPILKALATSSFDVRGFAGRHTMVNLSYNKFFDMYYILDYKCRWLNICLYFILRFLLVYVMYLVDGML